MMIARRADTRARADFATWTMMAKLNGTSSLPPAAQAFLERYKALLKEKSSDEASEAVIQLIYQGYYEEMGGAGQAPDVKPRSATGPGERQRHGFQAPAGPAAEGVRRTAAKVKATGCAYFCLPGRRLYRVPVLLPLKRFWRSKQQCRRRPAFSFSVLEVHVDAAAESVVGERGRRTRHRIGAADHVQRGFVKHRIT